MSSGDVQSGIAIHRSAPPPGPLESLWGPPAGRTELTLVRERQFQNSDFGGELSPAQLKYCANDVIYLHKIHDELINILERENRIELYKNCLKFLKIRVDLDLASFKDDIWSH